MQSNLAIVPAYNEAASIGRVVGELRQRAADFDVLVIDDGSTDETAARAKAAGARVLRHPFNLGIGGAVQSGYVYALERGYDTAVQVDGDGQHDPACVHALLRHLRAHPELDMVTGSRFLAADGGRHPPPPPRPPSRRTATPPAPPRRAAGAPASSPRSSRGSSASR